jgi:predicted transcriptional regulator
VTYTYTWHYWAYQEFQAAALLIAAKRADQVSSEIAVHTEKTADEIKILLQQNTELTQAIKQLTKEVHEKVTGIS